MADRLVTYFAPSAEMHFSQPQVSVNRGGYKYPFASLESVYSHEPHTKLFDSHLLQKRGCVRAGRNAVCR